MTSLLATQLNKLRLPEGQVAGADYRRRKSLIHSPTELNKLDPAAHLERAQKAFQHLLNIDPSLQEFQDCFFSEDRLNFEPSMQMPDQKAALDQIIEHFFLRVSQHLLLGVTLDALEWLVYRFQTHLYNMDAMLQAVLPYHGTNLFPKFLQLFDFNAHNRRWHWLKPLANQGSPLSRTDLIRMASRDESLLAFVCQLVQRAFKAFGAADEARLRLFVNLYAQVTLSLLMKPLDEARLSKCVNCLNFYLLKAMRSISACYRHSAYQIVQLLAVRHRLSGSVLYMWIKRLLKSAYKHDPAEVCLLIGILCKTQKFQVPDDLTERFLTACSDCQSGVLNDFPGIVSRSTESVDIVFDEQNRVSKEADSVAKDARPVDIDAVAENEDKKNESASPKKRSRRKFNSLGTEDCGALESDLMKLLQAPAARGSGESASAAPGTANQPEAESEAATTAIEPAATSALHVVAALIRLLASPVQSVRCQSLASLRHFLAQCRPGNSDGAGPLDESEEDALVWDTADAVLADARSIEHDRHWVMRQQLAPACSRLVYMSMADLVDTLASSGEPELTPVKRQCLLSQLQFLQEAQLVSLMDGGETEAPAARLLLLSMIRLPDGSVAKAVAMKITPAVFNRLSSELKLLYLTEGLGSTPLTEDSDVLRIASGYSVDTVVYLDALANLFGLVPTRASIQNLSAKRKSIAQQGNAYIDMSEPDKRQARLLFRLIGSDARSDRMGDGLQLVVRLLEVLQILVQAHTRTGLGSAPQADAVSPEAASISTIETIVSDIGLCLVAADRAAIRTPDADARASGLADLIPLQSALHCARTVADRQCQYAAVSLLCRLCRLAPASAAACCRGLVDFLARGGFFGRADRHSEELWQGLVGSVLPAYARCHPSAVPLLAALLVAYDDMPPSRRAEVFAQLVGAVGVGAHLWALLLLLLNRRRSQQPPSRRRKPADSSESKPPPNRRRRLSESASLSEDSTPAPAPPPAPPAAAVAASQFDSLASSVLASFPAAQQLLALAGLLRYLLRRIDPASFAAAADASSAAFLDLENQTGEDFNPDEYFGFDDLDDEAESNLLSADACPASSELARQLDVALSLVAAHLSRRDLLTAMAAAAASADGECDGEAAAMTQLLGSLVTALLWATNPSGPQQQQQQQQQRHLAAQCVRAIERAEQAVPGAQFLRVVCGLLARPEQPVRRKALDLMLSKLSGLEPAAALPLLRRPLLDCLDGVEPNCSASQVALICGRELVRLLGQSEPKLVLNFCLRLSASEAASLPKLADGAALSASESSSGGGGGGNSWESFGCALLVFAEAVKQLSIDALPLVAGLTPSLLAGLRGPQQPPSVVLLAAYTFLQQCCVSMVDLMVPYLADLLPVTVALVLTSDAQLKPKLRAVLSAVARGVHPSQLLPVLQHCLQHSSPTNTRRPWLPAEQWARLLRLNLHSADRMLDQADDLEDEDAQDGCLADFEAELTDLLSRLLESVFRPDDKLNLDNDAAGAAGSSGDSDVAESDSDDDEDEDEDAENGPDEQAQGRLVAQLAACLTPLPASSRAMLLQSLQDWAASGSASREAAFHRLLTAALTAAKPGTAASGALANLLCELDVPQHTASLLELGSRRRRLLARWLLAFLSALLPASSLSLDLLDSLGRLLVDRLVAGADADRHLQPCLVAYAKAAGGDEALLKPLIRRLSDLGCRHATSAKVRLASLRAVQSLMDSLGDDFIDSLAADCVPALAELAEDDSEEIERLAQRLLTEIERRAGEPLEL